MKWTSIFCSCLLIACGLDMLCVGLFGLDPVLFLLGGSQLLYRIFLVWSGVAALWQIFWMAVFKPQNNLN